MLRLEPADDFQPDPSQNWRLGKNKLSGERLPDGPFIRFPHGEA